VVAGVLLTTRSRPGDSGTAAAADAARTAGGEFARTGADGNGFFATVGLDCCVDGDTDVGVLAGDRTRGGDMVRADATRTAVLGDVAPLLADTLIDAECMSGDGSGSALAGAR
jgi:hypothetical protein